MSITKTAYTKNIQVFCTPEQHEFIIINAKKLGLRPSTFLRMLGLKGDKYDHNATS